MIQLSLISTGYCLSHENMILRGSQFRSVRCHAVVAVLRHPQYGIWLFDTGYAQRVFEGFQTFPFQLYGLLTPVTTQPQWEAKQIKDVNGIIISHFHADHIGGLLDFPDARLVCSNEAYQEIRHLTGFAALKRGFIPSLMPLDFDARVKLISDFIAPPLPILGRNYDLFGDGSVRLVLLPGHAKGQIGAWCETERGSVLLAADGAWHSRAIRENLLPHPFAMKMAFDDPGATKETLSQLYQLYRSNLDIQFVPTHCPEIFEQTMNKNNFT
jgi:glyoxylase-like metal-dependent hydrolase (beta-lactamase superfamily II)